MARPCGHTAKDPDEDCGVCQKAADDPRYAALWDLGKVELPRAPFEEKLRSPCVHEGAILDWCPHCKGEARHVRECDLHGKCTRGRVSTKVRSCLGCPDHKLA